LLILKRSGCGSGPGFKNSGIESESESEKGTSGEVLEEHTDKKYFDFRF